MATPPNPFDQEAVDAYLKAKADKAREDATPAPRADTPAPASGPSTKPTLTLPTDDPGVEAITMLNYWAERGADVYAEAVLTIANEVATSAGGLEAAVNEGVAVADEPSLDELGADEVYQAARLGYGLREAGNALYLAARAALWQYVGKTPGKNYQVPSGGAFSFKAGAKTRRSTNYKVLEADYPEAYNAAVKVTATDPAAPGTLNL